MFWDLEKIFSGLRGKNWLLVYFRSELRSAPQARAFGVLKATTFMTIAPMAMSADQLMAVMQHMVECANAANVATPDDVAGLGA